MRKVDVCVIAAVLAVMAAVAWLLILTGGPAAAAFVSGLALLFGIFVIASLSSRRYGHAE